MNETLLFQSATDAAQAVRRKESSSRELTETLLARIEAINPALNTVVELRPEAACNCASKRLKFLGNLALLPWLSPSGPPYLTLTDATRIMAVAV